ncbi:hypothetical protein GCM10009557_40560 [Virgisporangium ochraceum]
MLVLTAAVAADRIAARMAAGRLETRLACLADLSAPARVDVRGFPFLAQAAAGRYREIVVTATDISRGGLRVARVEAVLRDLRTGDGRTSVGELAVAATAGFDSLPTSLGERPVRYSARGDRLAITTELALAGQRQPVTILALPRLTDGTLTIQPETVEVLGIQRPAERLLARVGLDRLPSRALPSLAEGLTYRSVEVVDDGLRITVDGHDLSTGATGSGRGDVHCGRRR